MALPGAQEYNFARHHSQQFDRDLLLAQGLTAFVLPHPVLFVDEVFYRDYVGIVHPISEQIGSGSAGGEIDQHGPYGLADSTSHQIGFPDTRALGSVMSASNSGITMLAWFQQDGDTFDGWGRIVSKSKGGTSDDYALTIKKGNREPIMRITATSTVSITASSANQTVLGIMHTIGGTWRRSDGQMHCLADGNPAPIITGTSTGNLRDTQTDGLGFGAGYTSNNRAINGRIYHARLYRRWMEDEEVAWHQNNPGWAFDQAIAKRRNYFVSSVGDQEVTTPHISATVSMNAPTVAPGPVALTLANIASGLALNAPTVAPGAVELSLSSIGSGLALNAPAVSPGAVSLALSAIASGLALNSPTVAPGPITITLPDIGSGLALFNPELAYILDMPLIAAGSSLNAPTIAPGPVTLTLPALASGLSLFAPEVSQGLLLELPLLGSGLALFAPTVAPGPVTLTLAAIGSGLALNAPTVAPGAVTLTLPLLGSTLGLFAPSVSLEGALALPLIGPDTALFAPAIIAEALLELPAIGPDTTLFAPSTALNVALSFISSTSSVSEPELAYGMVLPAIGPDTVISVPALDVGPVSLSLPLIGSSVVVGQPELAYALDMPAIPSGLVLGAPDLAYSLDMPLISSTSQLFPMDIFVIGSFVNPTPGRSVDFDLEDRGIDFDLLDRGVDFE